MRVEILHIFLYINLSLYIRTFADEWVYKRIVPLVYTIIRAHAKIIYF